MQKYARLMLTDPPPKTHLKFALTTPQPPHLVGPHTAEALQYQWRDHFIISPVQQRLELVRLVDRVACFSHLLPANGLEQVNGIRQVTLRLGEIDQHPNDPQLVVVIYRPEVEMFEISRD